MEVQETKEDVAALQLCTRTTHIASCVILPPHFGANLRTRHNSKGSSFDQCHHILNVCRLKSVDGRSSEAVAWSGGAVA